MKKYIYFAFIALVMAGMSACEKDPVETPDVVDGGNGGGGNPGNGPLVGTEWVYSESETEEEDGIVYEYTMSIAINFTTAQNGKIIIGGGVTINGQPFPEGTYEEEMPFTYTYDGTATAGTGNMTSIDEETGQPSTVPFSIIGNELTMVDEDENGEPMEVVFTRK